MAETMKYTAEAVAQAINEYENKKDAFTMAHLQISSAVSSLMGNYKSDAANKFYSKFGDIYNNLKQVDVQMESAIGKLKEVEQITNALIASQVSAASSIETDAAASGNIFG